MFAFSRHGSLYYSSMASHSPASCAPTGCTRRIVKFRDLSSGASTFPLSGSKINSARRDSLRRRIGVIGRNIRAIGFRRIYYPSSSPPLSFLSPVVLFLSGTENWINRVTRVYPNERRAVAFKGANRHARRLSAANPFDPRACLVRYRSQRSVTSFNERVTNVLSDTPADSGANEIVETSDTD